MSDRILVVDDDPALRESLQLVLSAEGYAAAGAADGDAALARIEAESFDVILCDLRMPGMDGMELLPQLVLTQAPQNPSPGKHCRAPARRSIDR